MQQEQKGLGLMGLLNGQVTMSFICQRGNISRFRKKLSTLNKKGQIRQFGHSIKSEEEGFIFRTSSSVTSQDDLMLEIDEVTNESS